jgi:hypothetical protein
MNKKKLTLSIEPRLNQRLDIEAAIKGKGHDRSSIVDSLILGHIQLPDDWDQFLDGGHETPEPTDVKASGRKVEKTTFYVSIKAYRTLGLHSQETEKNRSRIVEALIEDHVPPWAVYDSREYKTPARRSDRQSREAPISDSVALAS